MKNALEEANTLNPSYQKKLIDELQKLREEEHLEKIKKQVEEMNPAEREAFLAQMESKQRNKGGNKTKPKDFPRDGRTGWNFFTMERGADLKAKFQSENPDITSKEIKKKVGEAWQLLSEAEKAPFEEKARQDKAAQAVELETFKKTHPELFGSDGKLIVNSEVEEADGETPTKSAKKRAKVTKKKDPNAPKRSINAYFFFQGFARKKQMFPKENFATLCSEHWKNMSAEAKAPYEELAALDRQRYDEEKAAYVPGVDVPENKKSPESKTIAAEADQEEGEGEEDSSSSEEPSSSSE